MPRQANQTSAPVEDIAAARRARFHAVRGPDGKFAPRPPLDWTNVDAPETVSRLYEGSGMAQMDAMQVPTAHHPLPPNLLDADAPLTPAETAQLTRGEIIALTAMSVIGIALIVSGLVWL